MTRITSRTTNIAAYSTNVVLYVVSEVGVGFGFPFVGECGGQFVFLKVGVGVMSSVWTLQLALKWIHNEQ